MELVSSFSHELFAWFGVLHCIVTDNGSQFMPIDTIARYHPRSNGQAERFVDTLKRALKKPRDTPTDKSIQQFLQVYRVTPYNNAPSAMTPAEVMFVRKIKSLFDKLLPNQSKHGHTNKMTRKRYKIGENVFFRMFQSNKSF